MVLPPLLRPGGLGGTRWKHRLGFHLATRNPARFRRRRRGAFSPPHPRRNQCLMIPSGPIRPPGHEFPRPLRTTSFQRAKGLQIFPSGWEFPLLEEIPRKIKIIVNPTAGGGKGRKLFPLLRQKLLDRKAAFHLQFSESAEHVTHLARQAQGEGYNFIISCGGDGTNHQILQAMVGSRFILGFIPMGTGNDFPANLGIKEDMDFACHLRPNGKIRKIDVIQVDSAQFMAGVGGVGFDSEVNAMANKISPFLKGKAAYILPVLLKTLTYRPKEISD